MNRILRIITGGEKGQYEKAVRIYFANNEHHVMSVSARSLYHVEGY